MPSDGGLLLRFVPRELDPVALSEIPASRWYPPHSAARCIEQHPARSHSRALPQAERRETQCSTPGAEWTWGPDVHVVPAAEQIHVEIPGCLIEFQLFQRL